MPLWSIKIVPVATQIANKPAAFVPDVPNAKEGDPLNALKGDLVSWNNTTNDVHQPWPTDQNYNPLSEAEVGPRGSPKYLSDEVPANGSSRPSWTVAQVFADPNKVYYYCKKHPLEHGTIVITG